MRDTRATRIGFGLTAAALLFAVAPVDAGTQQELHKLLASDGGLSDNLGFSIDISEDRVVIGAPGESAGAGAAYLFSVSAGMQLLKLTATDGAAGDNFGAGVAIFGDTVIVGATFGAGPSGVESGSAYLFDAATGAQITELVPSDASLNDNFGSAVGISGDLAVIGSRFDDDNGINSGSAYLFKVSTAIELHKLVPSDGVAGALFGQRVAISGSRVLVGAQFDSEFGTSAGAAYLFGVTGGSEQHKLTPADLASGDEFGSSVAISGLRALVGSAQDDDNGSGSGSAYLFGASSGTELGKLTPADGGFGDAFGSAVSIDGTDVVIGALGDNDNGSASGSAYTFDAMTMLETAKLLPSDGQTLDSFGAAVAVQGGAIGVGAPFSDDGGAGAGSAYLFGDCELAADLNGDGMVDAADLGILIGQFGTAGPEADINGDSMVDAADLGILIGAFGSACP